MEASTSLYLLALAALLLYLFLKRKQTYWSRKGIPQLDPNILFGDARTLALGTKSQADFFLELYQKCKSLNLKEVGIYTGLMPVYMPVDLDLMKRLLVKDFSYFGGRGMFNHEEDLLTMNLFFMEGETWKNRRNKLSPLFTTGKLKKMFDTVSHNAMKLNQMISKSATCNQVMDIKDLIARFTTDNIANLAFGLDSDTLQYPNNELRELGRRFAAPAVLKRTLELLFNYDFLVKFGYRMFAKELYVYFPRIIRAAIDYRENTGYQKSDFLQLMLELKKHGKLSDENVQAGEISTNGTNLYLTTEEIITEAFLMYGAGFETSSSAATFAIYELALNQQIQDKLRNEIIKELEQTNGEITYESVVKLEYLDRVIKESLRKYPVLPVVTRQCLKDYKFKDSNKIIEKGTRLVIPIMGLHRDPDYFPNPDEFNPDNFSPENEAKRPNNAYIPFGDGPRLCIGMRLGLMQSKMALVSLVKDFRFVLDESEPTSTEFDSGSFVTVFKGKVLIKAFKI